MGLSPKNNSLSSSSVAKRTAIRRYLGVSEVGKSEASVNKPSTISSAEQTTILNTIQAGLIPHQTNPLAVDGSLEVDHFMSLLDKLSTDLRLSSDLKDHIDSIKDTFLAVEDQLDRQPLPINDVTVQNMVPNMLSGIQQLFELFDGFDGIDESVKGTFSKVSTLARECSESFSAGPPKDKNMVNHVKRKANYFLNKKETPPFNKANDVLTVIMVFADVNSSLKLLCPERDGLERPEGSSEISTPNQPSLPVRTNDSLPKLETSDLVKDGWEFSSIGLSGLRLFDCLNDLSESPNSTRYWDGTKLKGAELISESALRDLELLNRAKIEKLSKDLQAKLLQNLQRLKSEFDLPDLYLPKDSPPTTITKKIKEGDRNTDIRAFVQGHIDLLNDLIVSS